MIHKAAETRENPARAGPEDKIRIYFKKRRRCLWKKSTEGRTGGCAS